MHFLSMFKSQIKISLGGDKTRGMVQRLIIVLIADTNLIYNYALSLQKILLDALSDSRYK